MPTAEPLAGRTTISWAPTAAFAGMVTVVAARFPLASIVAVTSCTGELQSSTFTLVLAGKPLPETSTSSPGLGSAGSTLTDGEEVTPPVGQAAAGDVVDVVVELPPVVVVVEPVVVDVVVAAAPNPTSMKAPATVASSPFVART